MIVLTDNAGLLWSLGTMVASLHVETVRLPDTANLLEFLITVRLPVGKSALYRYDFKSHSNKTRQKADETKNKALKAAGIEIVRWPANSLPSEEDIKAKFITLKLVAINHTSKKSTSGAHSSYQRVEPVL